MRQKLIAKITLLFIIFSIHGFAQFQMNEKVDIRIEYSSNLLEKPSMVSLVSTDEEIDISYYNDIVDDKQEYTFYNVEPGKYSVGLDFEHRYYLNDIIYGLNIDEEGQVSYGYSIENEVELYENRNLKILLNIVADPSFSGVRIKKRIKYTDYDYIEMIFYLGSTDTESDFNSQIHFNKSSFSQLDTGKDIQSASRGRVRRTIKIPYRNYISSENPYANAFDNCGYCKATGATTPESLGGKDCIYMKFGDVRVIFELIAIESVTVNSKEAIQAKMGQDRFGACGYQIFIDKNSLTVSSMSCSGDPCKCIFSCSPLIRVVSTIRYFDCNELKKLADKFIAPYRDSNNKIKIKTYDFYSDACACHSLEQAFLEHEMFHCTQYNRQVKDLVKAQTKNVLEKICNKIKRYKCLNKKTCVCDIQLCDKKIEKVRKKVIEQFNK